MHFNDILSLAARAWHEVKDPKDPEFNQCQITHRENLGAAAQAVVDSGLTSGATPFDKAVMRIYRADAEAQSEADRILAENPTLHGDEVMHIASGTPHPLAMPGHAENMQMAAVREEFRGIDPGFAASETVEQIEADRLERARRREEAQPKELKGPLPKDFPAHDLLHAAGINTYTQLIKQQASEDGLEGVEGVGPATAEKIANRLVEDSQKEN